MASKKRKHGTDCNIYRLQDVYSYVVDPSAVDLNHPPYSPLRTPKGQPLRGKARERRVMALARRALHDACVSVPRSMKTPSELLALAEKVGNAHGFDVAAGEYYKK